MILPGQAGSGNRSYRIQRLLAVPVAQDPGRKCDGICPAAGYRSQPFFSAGIPTGSSMVSVFGDIRDLAHLKKTMTDFQPDIVFILRPSPWSDSPILNPLKHCKQISWERPMFLKPAEHRTLRSGPSSMSPVTSAMKTGNGSGDIVKMIPWAGMIPTARPKAAPSWSQPPIEIRFSMVMPMEPGSPDIAGQRACRQCDRRRGLGQRPHCHRHDDGCRKGAKFLIRNPNATRPWQHVLEPLSGYLQLGQNSLKVKKSMPKPGISVPAMTAPSLCSRWYSKCSRHLAKITYPLTKRKKIPMKPGLLKLDCSKARTRLSWSGIWSTQTTSAKTVQWYKAFYEQGTGHHHVPDDRLF
jgi:hypothetical protein